MLGGHAQPVIKVLATRAQAGRIRKVALALDEGFHAFQRMTGEKCALAPDQPIYRGLVGLRRDRYLVEFTNCLRAIFFRNREFARHERAQHRKVCAHVGRQRRERLMRICEVACGDPLVRALQLEEIMVGPRRASHLRIQLGRFRMLAITNQPGSLFLAIKRGLGRIDQAATGDQCRNRYQGAEPQPWTSSDHCHTLMSLYSGPRL